MPPSVLMVIYGLLTETSIGELFLAGILPGILLVVIYMITVSIVTNIWPHMGPRGEKTSIREKIYAFKDVGGTLLLFLLVIGGIYTGLFSPEEAAGIGAAGALLIGIINRSMTFKIFFECLMESVKTTSMVFTILFGALLFNDFLVLSDLTFALSSWIEGLPFPPLVVLIVILGVYLVLGCALDTLAMVLLTVPIFFPVILALGFDRVWFGIIVVLVVELGLITPPIGMNVFVIAGMAKDVPLIDIFKGVFPFVIAQILIIAIVVAWPDIALILPRTMM
jgi:tripartite ATP-independent transporter DctM subunit